MEMKPVFQFLLLFLLSLLCGNAIPSQVAAAATTGAKVTAPSETDTVALLLKLKASLKDPTGALKDWVPTTPHCNWTGVRCSTAVTGAVEAIVLPGRNLSGTLDGAGLRGIGGSLTALDLSGNSFDSAIPLAIADLPVLRDLDLSDNLFAELPRGFFSGAASATLRSLNMSGNNLGGELPSDLINATALEVLDFRGGYFIGPIPPSYGSLRKLSFLGLSGNNLTGRIPSELGQLSQLETFIIGYNFFEGPIPPSLGNLTSLRYLDIAVGGISGAVPPELGNLPQLDTVYLFKNALDGKIPKELGNLSSSSLAFLDLSDNLLTGPIPLELGRLKSLQLLNLMCNRLTGSIPSGLAELTQLEVLELWNNSLTGPLPAALGQNSPLTWLDVSSNSLSDVIPLGLCDSKNLTKLILFNNNFSGGIPPSLTTCESLVRVRLHNNRLNGTIPTGFGKLPHLQRLEVAGNEFTGGVPEDISSSATLSFIDISRNKLVLPLPQQILSVPSLQNFLASGNAIPGSVPDDFLQGGGCPSLAVLDLSGNKLTGAVPSSLAICKRLVRLDLSDNNLTGEIPSAMASMPALSVLDLSGNQLTGRIPDTLGSSPTLETLDLSRNRLSGPVPPVGLLRTISPNELAGNAGLCGGVLPPCDGSSSSTSSGQRGIRLRHVIAGWAIGISVVFAIGAILLGSRYVYQNWWWYYLEGGGCCDRFDRETGEWPWRLTAFQRLGFTSGEVLACVKDANVVGMGATGVVYKAEMPRHHATVAVKKLWRTAPGGSPVVHGGVGSEDIAAEVALLGRLRHRNIVRMLGFLRNDTDAMILYEYMPNGSLWEALHGSRKDEEEAARVGPRPGGGGLLVDWVSRYNVACGVAQGLAYLHHDCHPPVIHRDVKSNNILLDANLDARIADFGLAKTMLRKNETVSVIAGSYGYIAPEYGYTLKVDHKSDIYSFGVVLMELLTGRKPIETEYGECHDIVGWVRDKLIKNQGIEVLDPDIGGKCRHVQEEMMLVLRIAVLCTAKSPKDRPLMRDVLSMLAEAKPRRKSSSNNVVVNTVVNDKPVFTTAPQPHFP